MDRGGMGVTCLRFATACGMSPRLRLDLVLNDFVAGALASGEVSVLSDGTPWRPLIDVRDMARAIEWAITGDGVEAGGFLSINAGSDDWNVQVRDLAHAVAAGAPGTRVSINKDAPPDKRSYRVDFSLFRKMAPDHQPRVTLADSVERLRDGLRRDRLRRQGFPHLAADPAQGARPAHGARAASARICAGRAPIEKGGSTSTKALDRARHHVHVNGVGANSRR